MITPVDGLCRRNMVCQQPRLSRKRNESDVGEPAPQSNFEIYPRYFGFNNCSCIQGCVHSVDLTCYLLELLCANRLRCL